MKELPVSALDQLIRSEKPIYVTNTSRLPSGDKGTILVHFFDGQRREYFKMPPTFIPMAISDVIPKKSLAASRDFKQLLIKGMLTLVDPDDAQNFMETEDALEEYEDLSLSEMSMRSNTGKIEADAKAAKRLQSQVAAVEYPISGELPMDEQPQEIDPVSNRVKALLQDSISGNRPMKEIKQELRRQASNFSAADFHYIKANARDASLVNWAIKALTALDKSDSPAPRKLTGAAAKAAAKKAARVRAEGLATAGTDEDDYAPEDPSEAAEAARHQVIGATSSLDLNR